MKVLDHYEVELFMLDYDVQNIVNVHSIIDEEDSDKLILYAIEDANWDILVAYKSNLQGYVVRYITK